MASEDKWTPSAFIYIWLSILSLTLSSPAWTEERHSDQELSVALIGNWIVASESVDRNPTNSKMEQVFRSDGTYVVLSFVDKLCGTVALSMIVKWRVENGMLITTTPSGRVLRDQILGISKKKMTLRSLDDGEVFIRERSEGCSPPIM